MSNENTKAVKEMLEAYKENPSSEKELKVALLISIATSLAVIADSMAESGNNERYN